MLEQIGREIVACRKCSDYKRVYADRECVPCPDCAGWDVETRLKILKDATRAGAEKPSIRMVDLSDEEKVLMAKWAVEHPNVHELTLLTWVEGRRYDPAKDPEFLTDARKAYRKWQFYRHTNEGPLPDWAKNALATGQTGHLTKSEKEYVTSLKEGRNV